DLSEQRDGREDGEVEPDEVRGPLACQLRSVLDRDPPQAEQGEVDRRDDGVERRLVHGHNTHGSRTAWQEWICDGRASPDQEGMRRATMRSMSTVTRKNTSPSAMAAAT